MMQVVVHRSGQHYFFQITADTHHILYRVFMADAHDILFDNGPGIQLCRHIMAGRANNFDANRWSASTRSLTRTF